MAVSEAQALSGELIDLKKVRFDRLKRPSVASFEQSPRDREDRSSGRSGIDATALEPGSTMQGLDVDGTDLPAPLENLQWPVASLNKAIRDVEDRITKELRDGITSHDPNPILRDLKTEVTQVRSRLDELNERIEQLCVSPASRSSRDDAPPPPRDIGALETLLVDLAEKIDSAIADSARGTDVVAPIDEVKILEARRMPAEGDRRVRARRDGVRPDRREDSPRAREIPHAQETWRHSSMSRPDRADLSCVNLDFLSSGYSPRRLHARIDAAGGPAAEKALEGFGIRLAQRRHVADETKELRRPEEPRASHPRVKWKPADREELEATQWVRVTLTEAARWTVRRGVAEIKSIRNRKPPDGDLWMSHETKDSFPGRIGGRDKLSRLPSLTRASVFGVAGALFVFCGYSLSRPAVTGSNLASPNALEKAINAVSSQGGAKPKFDVAVARANATESATPSLARSDYVARPESSGGFISTWRGEF